MKEFYSEQVFDQQHLKQYLNCPTKGIFRGTNLYVFTPETSVLIGTYHSVNYKKFGTIISNMWSVFKY